MDERLARVPLIVVDPRESKNLANDPEHATVVAGPKELLQHTSISNDSPIRAALAGAVVSPCLEGK